MPVYPAGAGIGWLQRISNLFRLAGGIIDPFDTFTRTDSAVSLGTSSSGHLWTVTGTWGIQTNRAYSPSSGFATIDSGVTDHSVTATIVTRDATGSGVVARYVDANNFYIAFNTTDGLTTLYRRNNGAYNQLGGVAGGANGDIIKLECIGTAQKVYRNGVEVISTTNGSLTTGTKCGMATGSNTARLDDFSIDTTP